MGVIFGKKVHKVLSFDAVEPRVHLVSFFLPILYLCYIHYKLPDLHYALKRIMPYALRLMHY